MTPMPASCPAEVQVGHRDEERPDERDTHRLSHDPEGERDREVAEPDRHAVMKSGDEGVFRDLPELL